MTTLNDILPATLVRVLYLATTGQEPPPPRYNASDDPFRRLYWWAGYRIGLNRDECAALMGRPPPPAFRYRHFTVPKADGSPRHLMEPAPRLKATQQTMLRRYLNRAQVHPAAVGFRREMSIAHHAWPHAGAAIFITADIADFFPNTRADRIYAYWLNEHFSHYPTGADLFTRLTTYHGGLPQGAPTSPALSNAVNYELDAALTGLARRDGGTYTRYADDLLFSWPDGQRPPADFYLNVRAELRAYGYTLNMAKGWQQWQRKDEPQVTGLVFTREGRVDVPQSMRRVIRHLHRTASTPTEKRRLAGYEAFRRMVTQSVTRQQDEMT